MINSDKPENPMTPAEIYLSFMADRFIAIREQVDLLEDQFKFVLSNYLNSEK